MTEGVDTDTEDEFEDLSEQVRIPTLAVDGKFDNRKSIRKQGGVDFSCSEDYN